MSGAQIGGVIGAVAGSFIPGVGTQIGFMIGSAIGGYVDPVQVKGPRLSDAASQTSNVGVPLPFGYGRFQTAGNIIWRDPTLKEIAKRSRGKGGGTKTTTYSYTRSYAIGVCEGPIYGFLHIKRNGKLVYSSDPDATIEDKAYSAKWLQKAKLYYGTETQMPDSTITAVEGAGNVAPFRGLAYIVVENDDLTDLAGAIPQYEFVVVATPPESYLTSKPYAQLFTAAAGTSAGIGGITLRQLLIDAESAPDSSAASLVPVGGALRDILANAYQQNDDAGASIIPVGGALVQILKDCTQQPDNSGASLTPISGALVDIPVGKQATDNSGASLVPVGGSLYWPNGGKVMMTQDGKIILDESGKAIKTG